VARLGAEQPHRRQRQAEADQADGQQDGKVTRTRLVVRAAELELGAALVQQPRAERGDHQPEDHVDSAGQAGVALVVITDRWWLGFGPVRDICVATPDDVLLHAVLLVGMSSRWKHLLL
jgi:hypothetical protein